MSSILISLWLLVEQDSTFGVEALLSPPSEITKMDITLAYRHKRGARWRSG